MPYDFLGETRPRVAVVGGGITGMGAAWGLSTSAEVTVFESGARMGGHARTVIAGRRGDQPVDTGFIVFNRVNYTNLVRLFEELEVPVAESNMSFGASISGGRVEYALASLNAIFAQRRNAVSPGFVGMLRDILKFNAQAERLSTDETLSVRDLLGLLGTGDRFRDHYLLPFSGAIWSTPTQGILDFPAAAMMRFFRNHALLDSKGQHQWYTVRGGSVAYVDRLCAALTARGVDLRSGAPVAGLRRTGAGTELRTTGGEWQAFDHVILACHADEALALLSDASGEEVAALSPIRFERNEAVLHSDAAMMPRRRLCWSSWNYTEGPQGRGDRIGLTYWINLLQPIPQDDPLFVTLNPDRPIDEARIYDTTSYAHPLYDAAMLRAQKAVRALNGARATWFCGAWMRNGFHEDGLASGLDVARAVTRRIGERQAA